MTVLFDDGSIEFVDGGDVVRVHPAVADYFGDDTSTYLDETEVSQLCAALMTWLADRWEKRP